MKFGDIPSGYLRDLAEQLNVPSTRYEEAINRYQAICEWLDRKESTFSDSDIDVYLQGSFRLGTAIRPATNNEDYDLDIVCEVNRSKGNQTQEQLFEDFGIEIKAYAKRHGMANPQGETRCWTLEYHEEANFHMDILPSLPDSSRQRQLREMANYGLEYVDSSISITDRDHRNFRTISHDWPSSNPNGYAEWFYSRMATTFANKRRAMALLEAKVNVEEIPYFRVKTPLQQSVQILKRHRDLYFESNPDSKVSSIILTTLSARAYNQETTIEHSLVSILTKLDEGLREQQFPYFIPNPSDPRENFADRWNTNRKLRTEFFEWLDVVRQDFTLAAEANDPSTFADILAPRIGRKLVEASLNRSASGTRSLEASHTRNNRKIQRILDAAHRRPTKWRKDRGSNSPVFIHRATFEVDGFRRVEIATDAEPLRKGGEIRFEASTSVAPPYDVYWQIVNTGTEAARADDLRGTFQKGSVAHGGLIHTETTRYTGYHSIECFVVKNGYCVAQSGPFIVNVA